MNSAEGLKIKLKGLCVYIMQYINLILVISHLFVSWSLDNDIVLLRITLFENSGGLY